MTTPSVSDYTNLITSAHRSASRFVSTVGANVAPIVQCMAFLAEMPAAFDLDYAIGVQLDMVGEWVGLSRYITVPLDTPWFSWDTAGRGWDAGIWKGPLSPTTGISPLDDETYRNLLRAKIAANSWNGTVGAVSDILNGFFGDYGVTIDVEDRQDMSVNYLVPGATPSILMLSIMAGRYIPVKPAGVRTSYILPSVSGDPIFGFDMDTSTVGGWDAGAWGVTPEYILGIS
jgi:hypothetical protein